ncbi:hypothetical protein QNH23_14650 [Siminovitchia fortis]|nr:hypothetical protein [Siminovitchia fortis]WHY81127.1 hypothetical protein QNH23_14650 [Siminovitchia fortis]
MAKKVKINVVSLDTMVSQTQIYGKDFIHLWPGEIIGWMKKER